MTGLDDGAHFVEIEYDALSFGAPRLHFTCTNTGVAADGAPQCHLACNESSCAEGCIDPLNHELVDQGECQVVLWLNESDADACIIEDTSIKVPIAYNWHGEGVDWKFAITEARR